MPPPIPDVLLALGPTFQSTLPEPAAAWSGFGGFDDVEWSAGVVRNGAVLAGHLARNVAETIGWPQAQVGALIDIAQTAIDLISGKLSIDDALEAALKVVNLLGSTFVGALGDVQVAISGILDRVAASLPAVGLLLQMALMVRTSVVLALQRNLPSALDRPLQWSVIRDQLAAQAVLDVLKGGDWTSIWLAPRGQWGKVSLSYDPWGKVSGWRFGPNVSTAVLESTDEPDRLGWLPGILGGDRQLAGARFFEGPVWSTLPARECVVDGKKCPQASPLLLPEQTQATLAPSAAAVAGFAGTFLDRTTGACANVDWDRVEDSWQAWTAEGARFLDRLPQTSDPRDRALHTMVRGALGYHGGMYPGGGMAGAHVQTMVRERREQLWRQLGTLAVAYVRPSAPGLRTGRMRGRYESMQRALLQHSARYDVDLALVPPGEFRNALVASRKTPEGIGLAAPGVRAPRRRGGTIDRGPQPHRPRLPALGGGEGLAAIAAAIAVALFLA